MVEEQGPQVVGGLSLKEAAKGGTIFEIKHETGADDDDFVERDAYEEALARHLNPECLSADDLYEGEPFQKIAESMTDLLDNGNVKKKVLRVGYGSKPDTSCHVKIDYNAYIEHDAQPFDSTYARKKPFSFKTANNDVIPGLDIAIQSMQLNEKSQFLIQPELAFRSSGLGRIPPNSTVLFVIELLEVREISAVNTEKPEENDFAKVYQNAVEGSARGKNCFRLKDYHSAVKEYRAAAESLETALLQDYDEQLKMEELLVRLYTNLLICSTHMQQPKRGCIYSRKIYEMARNKTFQVEAKVFFNDAKCQRMLGNYSNAEKKLAQARRLEPQDGDILKEFEVLRAAKLEQKKRHAKLGRALLQS